MAEKKPLLVYAAAYETIEAALADLDAIEQAHKDEMIGQYYAAVIDKEDGKPHVVKQMDRPHVRVIAEWRWRADHRKGAGQGADQGR